jgi:hypothetical protein
MEIPVKTKITGDVVAGQKLRGIANQQMGKLESLMEFQGLDQYSLTREVSPGEIIKTSKVFGERTIEITTLDRRGAKPAKKQLCLCNCNFTHGKVVRVADGILDRMSERFYDVLACRGKRGYKMYRNILASDFSRYREGQKVILIPYFAMEFYCCTATDGATGCTPVECNDASTQDTWRSTMRIIPWIGRTLPAWIDVKRADHE